MLFLSSKSSKITRVQGPYISEKEVQKVAAFIVEQGKKIGDPQEALSHSLEESLERVDTSKEGEGAGEFFGGIDEDPLFEEVKKIPVPRSWENFAVQELNYLLRSKKFVELIRNVDKDPLAALLALKERLLLMDEVRSFHKKTFGDLLSVGISFSPEEGGYKFFK